MLMNLLSVLGGLALFVYGLRHASDGLTRAAGERLRRVVSRLTGTRVIGFLVGAFGTLIMQSSTATTVILIGLAHTGVVTLAQAFPVMLGAGVGTTVTVLLISFHVSDYSFVLIIAGVVLGLVSKRPQLAAVAEAVLGFGLVFYGMGVMSDASWRLNGNPAFDATVAPIAHHPLAGLAVGTAVATVATSGGAMALALSLAQGGVLDLRGAIPIVLGANIGTCVSGLFIAGNSGADARRLALAHLITRLLPALAVMLVRLPFAGVVLAVAGNSPAARQIALAHLLFNAGAAALFLVLATPTVAVLRQLFRSPEARPFGPRFLDPSALAVPAVALEQARLELLRMGEIVLGMLASVPRAFAERSTGFITFAEEEDDKIDILNREIKLYVARATQANSGPESVHRALALVAVDVELELVGDAVSKKLLPIAGKLVARQASFSSAGLGELVRFHGAVEDNLKRAVMALGSGAAGLAERVTVEDRRIEEVEAQLRATHLDRLRNALPESMQTSSWHLDVLTTLRSISQSAAAIARQVPTLRAEKPSAEVVAHAS